MMPRTISLLLSLATARDDAKHMGDGYLQITRSANGSYTYRRINPTTVVLRNGA